MATNWPRLGIRINTVHPNAVYDTNLWNQDILKKRAESYGLSIKSYKKNNVLNTEITSDDVAELVCTILSFPEQKEQLQTIIEAQIK